MAAEPAPASAAAPVSADSAVTHTPAQLKALYKASMDRNEWVYNWKRVGEEEEEEEEEEDDDED